MFKKMQWLFVCLFFLAAISAATVLNRFSSPGTGEDNVFTIGGTATVASGGTLSIASGGTLDISNGALVSAVTPYFLVNAPAGVTATYGINAASVTITGATTGLRITGAAGATVTGASGITSTYNVNAATFTATSWIKSPKVIYNTSPNLNSVVVISTSLITTGEYTVSQADGKAGFFEVFMGTYSACGVFTTAAIVTMSTQASAATSTTNNNADTLNVYDGGTSIVVENGSGTTRTVYIRVTFVE